MEDSLAVFIKLNVLLQYSLAIVPLSIYPNEFKTYVHTKVCTQMFIAVFIFIYLFIFIFWLHWVFTVMHRLLVAVVPLVAEHRL